MKLKSSLCTTNGLKGTGEDASTMHESLTVAIKCLRQETAVKRHIQSPDTNLESVERTQPTGARAQFPRLHGDTTLHRAPCRPRPRWCRGHMASQVQIWFVGCIAKHPHEKGLICEFEGNHIADCGYVATGSNFKGLDNPTDLSVC